MTLSRPSRIAALALVLALASTGAGHAAGVPADADPKALELSVAASAALPLGNAAQRWAERLGAGGEPAIEVRVRPGGVPAGGNAAREIAALRDGAADLAVGSALQWSVEVPSLAVFALPWIAPDAAALERVAADPVVQGALARALERAGASLVAIAPLGHRNLLTTTPIHGPADLGGLHVRTLPLPIVQELLVAFGALPQSMPFAEAQRAFASGALQGQEGAASSLSAARIYALGPRYLTEWNATGDAIVYAARSTLWGALGERQRERLRAAAIAAASDADPPARDAEAREHMVRQGVVVTRLTAAGRATFESAAARVTARWRAVVGDDVASAAEAAARSTLHASGASGTASAPGSARD